MAKRRNTKTDSWVLINTTDTELGDSGFAVGVRKIQPPTMGNQALIAIVHGRLASESVVRTG